MRRLATALWRTTLTRHLLVTGLGLLVLVLVVESVDDFRAVQLTEMAYLATAAGGLTVLTGLNGQISLGHGALMAIGAYTAALLLPDDSVFPLAVVILAATAVTTAVGVLIGAAAARLRGPYLAGATLALAVAVPGIALHFRDTLGGEQGLRLRVPDAPGWVLDTAFFITGHDLTPSKYIAYVAWLTLVVVLLLLANLGRSRVGRRWRAVRDDEVAAELAGVDVARYRIYAAVVGSAMIGLTGGLFAYSLGFISPVTYGFAQVDVQVLIIVAFGGLGTLLGPVVGAAAFGFLDRALSDSGQLREAYYGAFVIAIFLFLRRGVIPFVVGLFDRLSALRRDQRMEGTAPGRAER